MSVLMIARAGYLAPLLLFGALAGCSRNAAVSPGELVKVPPRARTAGDDLLALAPLGANLIMEVDIARLRHNQVVGEVVQKLAGMRHEGWDLSLVERVDSLLFCAYDAGGDDAATLTLVRGAQVAGLGVALDERTAALGPPALIARIERVRAGSEPSLERDRVLMAARTWAMPARAEGASVRVAARLDFDARVALASQFDLDHVPTRISLWGDVADDLALVGMVRGEDADEARDLALLAGRWKDRLAAHPWVRQRFLQFVIGSIEIEPRQRAVRMVLVIGPRRLASMMARMGRALTRPGPTESNP